MIYTVMNRLDKLNQYGLFTSVLSITQGHGER